MYHIFRHLNFTEIVLDKKSIYEEQSYILKVLLGKCHWKSCVECSISARICFQFYLLGGYWNGSCAHCRIDQELFSCSRS